MGGSVMKIMDRLFVRIMAGVLLAFMAFNDFFATALTIAYRMNAGGAAERLGRLTPGDDYRRLIPLMDAVPLWLHGLWVLAGVLYLVAIAGVGRRTGWAYITVLAAVSIEGVAHLVGRPIVAATGVVVNPHPSAIATVVVPFVLPLFLALVLWQTGRSRPASR
jgi:hypothetical protein